ncbi:MAG: NADH-quinone oxidoreductase subunit C [Ignavibacteria bacterium]|jgi:NADH-quinone oxidoreductase subunit C|nr:NADH-quinone oxidoreductase subunit C [Ignavibacteria bacterium]MBK6876280.1 NADH-quinone oxidoreductase subunit C [Ignavibacteria bacterium]MBK9227046.1 NADH-quinone oxidoreductase subunit C [Ignavibacteria bacterium]
MNIERLELLKSKLQQFEAEYSDTNGSPGFYIDKDSVIDACRVIKNDLGFRSCVDAISVDRFSKKLRFEMIYNLVSIEHNERIFVKVRLDTKSPAMQSLSQVWDSANWYEREAYDLMGINFENHPDLRRMYMPEAYEYHPLRKDFPLMGIPDSIPLPNK